MIHKTQIGIVGAGLSGLLLSRLLALQGIESIVVERQSRDYVEGRIRAGVLEQDTMDLLDEAAIGARMQAKGLVHGGVELCFNGKRHPIDFVDLTGGKTVMVYGQTEVTKDLNNALAAAGAQIVYEAEAVTVDEFDSDRPFIRYRLSGTARTDRPVKSSAILLPAATGFTACRGAVSRPNAFSFSSVFIRSPGWASWPRRRRCRTS